MRGRLGDPLLVDVYSLSLGGKPDWAALVAAGPPWHGAILKVSEGVGGSARWQLAMGQWFLRQWPAVRDAAGERYGNDFFRGGYHYLLIGVDGAAQADHYLQGIEAAGGWGPGDLWPIVDVEEGSGNKDKSQQAIIDTTSAFVETVRAKTGRDVMLYGGWWLADKQIRSKMGCSWLWYPSYTAQLPHDRYERIGWAKEELLAWQYVGGGKGALKGYPHRSPLGDTDISAVTIAGGGAAALAWLQANLRPTASVQPTGSVQPTQEPPARDLRVTSPMMEGADVTAVQQKLAELGYAVGTLDGTYGPTTAAAVKAFQRDRGLHVDGVVGPQVRGALAGTAGSAQFGRVA